MKKILLFLGLALCHTVAFSQFKTIAEGPVFVEPEDGFARILQLKNGNTMFVVISLKNGLDIKIYDAKHKQKTARHLGPRFGKLKSGQIEAIFESNGNAVFLISEMDNKRPVLYRLIVDGISGTLKKEETIAELLPLSMKHGYAMAFGKVPPPSFYVKKDPLTDNYAVALFNSFESDRNKRIEVIMFGADHKELSRAYYKSPEDKFKYMKYIDMAIINAQTVNILAYAYNTRTSGGDENTLVLAELKNGASEVELHELEFARNLEIDRGVVKYNPITKQLIMLAFVAESDKRNAKYFTSLVLIDPSRKKVDAVNAVYPHRANEKSQEMFGRKNEFEGKPQNFFINPDGTFSVVYEELEIITRQYSTAVGGGYASNNTELKHIAVSTFDLKGKEINCYFIPKEHYLLQMDPRTFYHAHREGTAARLAAGDQFKSFAYVNGKDKIYVLFNDVEENEKRALKGKLTNIKGVSECDGFYYTLEGNNTLPPREFLFGKPEKNRDHNLVLFAVSDYDQEKNVYVTLKLSVEGNRKGVRLVWMEP